MFLVFLAILFVIIIIISRGVILFPTTTDKRFIGRRFMVRYRDGRTFFELILTFNQRVVLCHLSAHSIRIS